MKHFLNFLMLCVLLLAGCTPAQAATEPQGRDGFWQGDPTGFPALSVQAPNHPQLPASPDIPPNVAEAPTACATTGAIQTYTARFQGPQNWRSRSGTPTDAHNIEGPATASRRLKKRR